MTTKFNIGDNLYALNNYHKDKVDVPISIHKVTVSSIAIYENEEVYWIRDQYSNEEWGDYADVTDLNASAVKANMFNYRKFIKLKKVII